MTTKTKTTTPGEQTEAQRLCNVLLNRWNMQAEEVAARLRVSLNSIIRWRRGVTPQPGHMTALRELVEKVRAERKHTKVA